MRFLSSKHRPNHLNDSFIDPLIRITRDLDDPSESWHITVMLPVLGSPERPTGLLPPETSYYFHGLPQLDKSDGESKDSNEIPDLRSKNYRQLPWDMPVSISEFDRQDGEGGRALTEVTRPARQTVWIRKEEYFRSLHAIHFCHNAEFVRDHSVQGVRSRDERRRNVLGDVYYCINHPPHYRMMERRLNSEIEKEEDLKAKARQVRLSPRESPTLDSTDPVLQLPEASSLGRTDITLPGRLQTDKPLPLGGYSLDIGSESINSDDPSKTHAMKMLYKQAKVILKNILPPPETVNSGVLQQLYRTNCLTKFDVQYSLTESSESSASKEEAVTPEEPPHVVKTGKKKR
ncbi:unnamed protein product [Echinostoma caproni]|uniref:HSF_DOMAIN domain-containing protein n=1 Tax=Echinostoma caproni TaxID=27848 RepID=A0A183ANW1_9TREM|nr:unnamed protein product [Echinostoma caproni]